MNKSDMFRAQWENYYRNKQEPQVVEPIKVMPFVQPRIIAARTSRATAHSAYLLAYRQAEMKRQQGAVQPEVKRVKRFAAARARRLAREQAAGPGWLKQEWIDLIATFANKCLRCGSTESIVPDHVKPLCKGGKHHLSNIQPLCYACNLWKGQRDFDFRPSVTQW